MSSGREGGKTPEPFDWRELLSRGLAKSLLDPVLPAFLQRQRWYAGKGRPAACGIVDAVPLAAADDACILAIVEVADDAAHDHYCLPLAVVWDIGAAEAEGSLAPFVVAPVTCRGRSGVIYDAAASPRLPGLILRAVAAEHALRSIGGGILVPRCTAALEAVRGLDRPGRRLSGEQSNSAFVIADRLLIKIYRRLHRGIHPEVEIGRFLTDVVPYAHAPRLLGALERIDAAGTREAIAIVQDFIRNDGDGWTHTLQHLDRVLDGATVSHSFDAFVPTLARRVAELHLAFAAAGDDDAAFSPEPVDQADIAAWQRELVDRAGEARRLLTQAARSLTPAQAERRSAERLLRAWGAVEQRCVIPPTAFAGTVKTRIHGDLHLGQVVIDGGDVHIIDFEGEPLRPLQRRRAKCSPLRDVAGMLRSFDYAAEAAPRRRPDATPFAAAAVKAWVHQASTRFVAAYRKAISRCRAVPQTDAAWAAALSICLFEKALYELCYEAAHRPDWLAIPLAGVDRLLRGETRVTR